MSGPVESFDLEDGSGARVVYEDDHLVALNAGRHRVEVMQAEINLLRTRVAELERDQAALDWIEENHTSHGGGNGFTLSVFIPYDSECMRTAIYEVMARES